METRQKIGDAGVAAVGLAKENGDFVAWMVWITYAIVEGDKGRVLVLGWKLVARVKMQTHRS